MDILFETILKMSLSATVVAGAVILLRPLLRKAPRWITCALWALVAVRLLCPLMLESPVSMMPDTAPVAQQVVSLQPEAPIVSTGGVYPQENGLTVHIRSDIPKQPFRFQFWMAWAVGVAGMLVYLLVSFLTVRRSVRVFLDTEPGVRQCDTIDTPFILGIFRPVIYLPSALSPESRDFVLAHERAHLRRKDHWWKPIGFLLLSLHWFNPVLWLSYILLCRDIELACDEKVIREMEPSEKKAYSQALLQCSIRQRFVTACPLAFGEVGVKARIKSILSYKKPAFWIILVALIAGIGLGIFFLTDRPEEPEPRSTTFEAVVERVLPGRQLEVRVLGQEYTGTVIVSTKDLEYTMLTKGSYIFVSHDPTDLLSDGYVEKVLEIGPMEGAGIVNLERHLEGTALAVEGNSMMLQVRLGSTTQNYYVNLKGQVIQPKPGDKVLVHYLPGDDPQKLDLVQELRITALADWGVDLRVSDVTPTGLQLWIGVASGLPRTLVTTDNIFLRKAQGNGWIDVPRLPDGAFPTEFYELNDGDISTIDWTTVYGALEPGEYRLHKAFRCGNREEIYAIDFTVPLPPVTELDEAVRQTVRYYASRRLVNPPTAHDKTMEQIPQTENTGFLSDSSHIQEVGKIYGQITVSHFVLDHMQTGKTHTLSIAVFCKGYNHRQEADSCRCSMRLVLEENADGTFTPTSCMIPTQLTAQADAEFLFTQAIADRLREDWMLWDSLEKACDEQVTGGLLKVKGFGKTFEPESVEAKLIENAIASGKKLRRVYSDYEVNTLIIGETVYYFYFHAGIIHNATDDVYIQLTKEGSKTVNTIFQNAGAE